MYMGNCSHIKKTSITCYSLSLSLSLSLSPFLFTSCVPRCLLGGNNLQERHLVNWGEVMHANDLRRPFADCSNFGDGQSRCIGGKDAVIWDDSLQLLKDLVLDGQILKDCLYHHVNLVKSLKMKMKKNKMRF